MTEQTPIQKFERGVDLAKYPQILAPMAAVGAAIYSLSTGTLLGLVIAVGCFAYAMVWIFANASGAVVIFLRNLAEIRQLRTGSKGDFDQPAPAGPGLPAAAPGRSSGAKPSEATPPLDGGIRKQ